MLAARTGWYRTISLRNIYEERSHGLPYPEIKLKIFFS